MIYTFFIKPILFLFEPEKAHNIAFFLFKLIYKIPYISKLLNKSFCIDDDRLKRKLFGIDFKNPVGLAAGFDKNAEVFNEFSDFGFGFIEIGTVTPIAQSGNPKPRLFRLKKDSAIINRMGFNNDGVETIVNRLKNKYKDIIIGGNIGKNKNTSNEKAVDDYLFSFERIAPYVDYLVLNVSSPNTPGLIKLQEEEYLSNLLKRVQKLNFDKFNKPILVKISPDLSFVQIDKVLDLIKKYKVSGIIATNTTSKRKNLSIGNEKINKIGNGGLSGQPLFNKSLEIVSYIRSKNASLPIVAVGGISSPEKALQIMNAGASLIQIYTSFIYSGPSIVKKINSKLLIS